MTKRFFYFLIIFLIFKTSPSFGQDTNIQIPNFADKYSEYVKQLENGKIDIDYADFRNSFLESKQFGKKNTNYDNLRSQVYKEIKNNNYEEVKKLTMKMLNI